MKILIFVCLSFIFLGAGCSTTKPDYREALINNLSSENAELKSKNSELEAEKEDLEARVSNFEDELSQKQVQLEKTESAARASDTALQQVSKDQILTAYKVDSAQVWHVGESLLTASNNSPEQLCPNIIAERSTGNNLYWMLKNSIKKLETDYGKYRNSFVYIKNNLDSLNGSLQIVRDKCSSIRLEIER